MVQILNRGGVKPAPWLLSQDAVDPDYRQYWDHAAIAIPAWFRGGAPYDLVSRQFLGDGSGVQVDHMRVVKLGRGHRVDEAETGWRTLLSALPLAQPWKDSDKSKATFALCYEPIALEGGNVVFGLHASNDRQTGLTSVNNDRVRMNHEGVSGETQGTDIFVVNNKTNVLIGRFEQSNIFDLYHYVEGVFSSSASVTAPTEVSLEGTYLGYLRALAAVGARDAQGTGHTAVMSTEVWTKEQMDRWAFDPYGMFRPASRSVGRSPAGPVLVALAGNQPAATGALSAIEYQVALAGNQPAPSGALSAIDYQVALSGNQPAATGALSAIDYSVALAGNQPAPSGTIGAVVVIQAAVSGNQPTATGALSAIQYQIALSGNQPAATGALSAIQFFVALAGAQPAAAGALAVLYQIALAGAQPAATGTISAASIAATIVATTGLVTPGKIVAGTGLVSKTVATTGVK